MSLKLDLGLNNTAAEFASKIARAKQDEIVSQINSMLAEGVLKLVETQPVFTSEHNAITGKSEIKVSQSVMVVACEQETINDLRRENRQLREKIQKLREVFTSPENGDE